MEADGLVLTSPPLDLAVDPFRNHIYVEYVPLTSTLFFQTIILRLSEAN